MRFGVCCPGCGLDFKFDYNKEKDISLRLGKIVDFLRGVDGFVRSYFLFNKCYSGSGRTYRTFSRDLDRLEKRGLIVRKLVHGNRGRFNLVRLK